LVPQVLPICLVLVLLCHGCCCRSAPPSAAPAPAAAAAAAYYRGAMGILLVYDVTDEASFSNIRNWMKNIEQHASDNVVKARARQGLAWCGWGARPCLEPVPAHMGMAGSSPTACVGGWRQRHAAWLSRQDSSTRSLPGAPGPPAGTS